MRGVAHGPELPAERGRVDVEAHVVEDQRLLFERQDVGDEGVAELLRQPVHVRAEADGAQELGRLGRDDVPGLQPGPRLGEARLSQPGLRPLGLRVVPRLPKPSKWAAYGSRPATSPLLFLSLEILPAPPFWAARRPPGLKPRACC